MLFHGGVGDPSGGAQPGIQGAPEDALHDGRFKQEVIQEVLGSTPVEEILAKFSPERHLRRLPPEERLRGLSRDRILRYLDSREEL